MCGIVGILNLRPSTPPVEEALLVRMRDAMTHRGPDSAGVWLSPDRGVGLGHRRLSIIDLSPAGHQPMSNEDGSVWITFNGEIYNHESLRKDLEAKGHVYRSHSDTESLVHAYEEWGTSAVDRIDGMFAFAIWDLKKRKLWLVRDRMGKKPLYFTEVDGRLIFASEIKAILGHPSVKRDACEEALWHYLSFAVPPAPLTMFRGIFKLPPGTHAEITLGGGSTAGGDCATPGGADGEARWSFMEYWRPWQPTDARPTFDEYAELLREKLQEAVRRRLMSDVPFGVFLSGGVDSSANVALMAQGMSRPVDTFSVGFEDQAQAPYNEIQYARQVAALFKTNHHEILISDKHFFEFAENLAFYQDEPLSDPVCFPLYYVTKLARENGTIVIQVGEGSDELFAGYDIYRNYLRREQGWGMFQCLPKPLRQVAAMVIGAGLGGRRAMHLRRAAAGEPVFVSAALAFYDLEKGPLRDWGRPESSASWAEEAYAGGNPSMAALARWFPEAEVKALPSIEWGGGGFLKRMIHWECHQRLAELLLMRLDKMMMASSVEGRAPFLDTGVVSLAMRIPSAMKIVDGVGKAVLKRAVEPLLPHELIYRKKVGFCGGSGNMLTPAILDFASKTIEGTLIPRGWNRTALMGLVEDHRAGRAENSFQIWNLMNLGLWFKKWS